MKFHKRLKLLRKEKGLTQTDLAEMLDKTKGTISNYENQRHEPDLASITLFANFFNVSIDYLTGRSEYRHRVDDKELPAEIKELIHEGDIEYVNAIKDAKQKGISAKAVKEILQVVGNLNNSENFDK